MRTIPRRTAIAGIAATLLAGPAFAAAPARLVDSRFARFGSGRGPDHRPWSAILSRHRSLGRDGVARFDYARVDRTALSAYLDTLTATDPRALKANEAFAYWVNFYNALTVDVVARAYPVSSIRDIGGGVFSSGPWREKLVTVAGVRLSLDDMEHGILRPVWRDPRVHYAVNCASIGCPNLAETAYTGGRLAAMLDAGARAYINHPRGVAVADGRLTVSSIYDWFKSDFGGTDAGVLAHLRQYASPETARALDGISRISRHRYDWSLNG